MKSSPEDTIAAITTPPGKGAIAALRISGKDAFAIANTIFSRKIDHFTSHTAHYGSIRSEKGEVIDTVLLLLMKNPTSYTGEDSIEIFCHGGNILSRKILARILEVGARAAEPGEFTYRAYLNGKLDLAQAEAVEELISAENELALATAEQQLQGTLSQKIASFQERLTHQAAILEAWVDYPEEGLEFESFEEMQAHMEEVILQMQALADTFQEGQKLHTGINLCLIGAPNVGKSSLMNALLGKEKAIVIPIAGTTRDVLEEELALKGLHFRLMDTAGIRNTEEIVEKEGVRRSKEKMKEADLILFVLDASKPLEKEEEELLFSTPKEKTLLVWDKIDIASPQLSNTFSLPEVFISAKQRIGIPELQEKIFSLSWHTPPSKTSIFLTNARHKQALEKAISFCRKVQQGLSSNLSPEFIASDIKEALHALGAIRGVNVTEDILSAIFSKFCVGK